MENDLGLDCWRLMMISKDGVRVARDRAERLRRRLLALGALDRSLKPAQLGEYVVFPLKSLNEDVRSIVREEDAEIIRWSFEAREIRPRSLEEILKDEIPPSLLDKLPSSYDIIGDLILIEIPDELKGYARRIGEALMQIHPRVRSVLVKGETVGEYRVRRIEVIAGSPRTKTIHREHGCIYKLDLGKVFFNPRFSGERIRVARSVKPGERVLDMFAGVGPFSILIAKVQPLSEVMAIELNPDAYKYLVENIKLNKVEDRVKPILGDAREILKDVKGEFNRVIMDLPHSSINFLDIGLRVCKKGGLLNFYGAASSLEELSQRVSRKIGELGYRAEIVFRREILEVAPRKRIFALEIRKSS